MLTRPHRLSRGIPVACLPPRLQDCIVSHSYALHEVRGPVALPPSLDSMLFIRNTLFFVYWPLSF